MAESRKCTSDHLSKKSVEYRRALALVMALNLAMGVVEMVTGLLAGSQALKADALDFLGDGAVTGLALLAIAWSTAARTRAAILQGVFLALLGVSVLGATTYRVLVVQMPDASAMGVVSVLALVINVVSAALLLPHRQGDASVRAVWLFSRNDALGNAAVLLAAGAVAVTRTAWPDLVVAVVIAGLFLHSARDIVRDGMAELREETTAPVAS
jgi:Co/Zn/Cd efflux system component